MHALTPDVCQVRQKRTRVQDCLETDRKWHYAMEHKIHLAEIVKFFIAPRREVDSQSPQSLTTSLQSMLMLMLMIDST
jgi:hypothetical protein